MADARQLLEQLRAELQPLDERIVRHPYLDALEAGQVPRTALQAFAGQQYHILTSDLGSIALLVSRHAALPSRPFLLNLLQGEAAALGALPAFAAALGLGPARPARPARLALSSCSSPRADAFRTGMKRASTLSPKRRCRKAARSALGASPSSARACRIASVGVTPARSFAIAA